MKTQLIRFSYILFCFFTLVLPVNGQKKNVAINDANTPLHLLRPEYKNPYKIVQKEDVIRDLERVLNYLETVTPFQVENKLNGKEYPDLSKLDENARLRQGAFRITSYEWGVTYSALLAATNATADKRYANYVFDRFNFLSKAAPEFKKLLNDFGLVDPQMTKVIAPAALDDAGAICAAMIKASRTNNQLQLRPLIDNYMNYIMYGEYRLFDGTFARKRPQMNTLWLDDMFMSIPALVQMGKLTGEMKYINEAVKQVLQFSDRMWVEEKSLFRHGWVESSVSHPAFFWGRANGWAMLALTELLDELPESDPSRGKILNLLQKHINGVLALQSGEGFWHQLLDRNDSYLETSATAIFTYCMAHAINKGWIDAVSYGPSVMLGWNAVSTKINSQGQIEGTCVGTGLAFDAAFYCYRPISAYAAHGYGPVIWAGAEMIQLLKKQFPRMNDNAIQFYNSEQKSNDLIYNVSDPSRPDEVVAGSSRKSEQTPIVFVIGDSTVKNGRGKGDGGQWGWASFFEQFFDTTKVSVENHALGGRSSRTFITEGLWSRVFHGLKKGDYLFIQFGHNDGGSLNTGRARASLKGIGNESELVIMERNGAPEEVFSFGHYLRIYVRQAKAQGVIPILLSHTPGNTWENGRMNRNNNTYGKWTKEVAEQEGVLFIDMNDLIAQKCEAMGQGKTSELFVDRVHTTRDGAMLNCLTLVEALKTKKNTGLDKYLK